MSRRRHRRALRRLIRRVIRGALWTALVVSLLPGLAITVASGHAALGLIIVPAVMVATLVSLPFLLLGMVLLVAVVALPFAILAAVFGGPLYLLYRIGGARSRSAEAYELDDEDEALPADALLRRRFIAGEMTYDQFQREAVALLKDRYARGAIKLTEYEVELEKLIAPARILDVKRDPALAGAPRLS